MELRECLAIAGIDRGPLTLAGLAAALDRIGGFEARPLVAVAVSGGPDSMALVLVANRWAKERGGAAWGLTVDHGLRPQSAAEAALKAFVEQHPKDPMAGNAQYWLGETYYTRNRFLEAASAFAEGYKRYPKSAKAAEDLLKLGMSLSRANQKPNACLAFAQLDRDFPNPGASIRDRAATEKKHLGC